MSTKDWKIIVPLCITSKCCLKLTLLTLFQIQTSSQLSEIHGSKPDSKYNTILILTFTKLFFASNQIYKPKQNNNFKKNLQRKHHLSICLKNVNISFAFLVNFCFVQYILLSIVHVYKSFSGVSTHFKRLKHIFLYRLI